MQWNQNLNTNKNVKYKHKITYMKILISTKQNTKIDTNFPFLSEFNQNYIGNMGNKNMEYINSIWILYEH